jgi:hypothetical protein
MPPDVIFTMTMFASIWMVFTVSGMIWFLTCVERYLRIQTELYKFKHSENLREVFRTEMIARGVERAFSEKASFEECKLYRMREDSRV